MVIAPTWFRDATIFLSLTILASCMAPLPLDPDERSFPTAQFDPKKSVVPLWNNIGDLLDHETDERPEVNIPPQCVELEIARDLREKGLNRLDGFGNFQPRLVATFTEAVDEESLTDRVFFFCRTGRPRDWVDRCARFDPGSGCTTDCESGCRDQDPECLWDPTAQSCSAPILMPCNAGSSSCTVALEEYDEYDRSDCQGYGKTYAVVVTPQHPLDEHATCGVTILDGVSTSKGGSPFRPSPTWLLVRQADPPVVFDGNRLVKNQTPLDPSTRRGRTDLHDLKEIWDEHAPLLHFLESSPQNLSRANILLAWEFTTQTIFSPLDRFVPGSPAAISYAADPQVKILEYIMRDNDPSNGDEVVNEIHDSFSLKELGPNDYVYKPCDYLPCDAVGLIIRGEFTSPSFLREKPNPGDLDETVPDQWDDPLWPTIYDSSAKVNFLAIFPSPATTLPRASACGHPGFIFGHGLFGDKEYSKPLTVQMATAGYASFTINLPLHGDRKVQIDDSDVTGCDDVKEHRNGIQCFQHIIGSDLATGRDTLRQGLLDTMKLVQILANDLVRPACDPAQTSCEQLRIDGERIGYAGSSLGSILGSILTAMTPEIRAAVFGVGGAGWVNVFADSDSDGIRCPVVDELINGGILQGELWQGSNPRALCTTDQWKTDHKYKQFANLAQWVLDPADPASFGHRLGDQEDRVKVLVQQCKDDDIVPNFTTRQLARTIGIGSDQDGDGILDPLQAAVATRITDDTGARVNPAPTPAIQDAITAGSGLWLEYPTVGDPPVSFCIHGNIHFLAPVDDAHGRSTRQVQVDVLDFISENLDRVDATCP